MAFQKLTFANTYTGNTFLQIYVINLLISLCALILGITFGGIGFGWFGSVLFGACYLGISNVFFCITLIFSTIFGILGWQLTNIGFIGGFKLGLSLGGVFAYFVALVPGLACIQHFSLRLILNFRKKSPWNYARFLEHATDNLFMQKVGGGYIFVHRMMMEHFAQMELEK